MITDKAAANTGLPSPETLKRIRWLFWGGLAIFAVATALTSVWVLSHDTVPKVKVMQDQLAAAKPWLLAWRLVLMALLIGGYPFWIKRAAYFMQFHPLQRQVALNQRWRVTILVILVELLFAQRGPALLLHWLFPGR